MMHVSYVFETEAWANYEVVVPHGGRPVFVASGHQRKTFNPANEPSLISELAKLARQVTGPQAELLSNCHVYLRQFGLLGESSLRHLHLVAEGKRYTKAFDSLTFLQYHAKMVDSFMRLAFQETQPEGIEEFTLQTAARMTAELHTRPSAFFGGSYECRPGIAYQDLTDDGVSKREIALLTRDHFFEVALLGARRSSQEGKEVFVFPNLLTLIYWRLFDYLQSKEIRLCKSCKAMFFVMDKRQQYCPPFPDARESACAAKRSTKMYTFENLREEDEFYIELMLRDLAASST